MKTIGVREFRDNMAEYLGSDGPVAITRHGRTVGYFVPVRARSGKEAEDLPQAIRQLREALAHYATGEDEAKRLLDETGQPQSRMARWNASSFWEHKSADELAREQGVGPASLVGGSPRGLARRRRFRGVFNRCRGGKERVTLAEDIAQSRILLDTNVVSYLFRRDTRADFFQRFLEGRFLFVSFMTVAELFFGAYRNRWGAARLGRLETHLLRYTLLPLDYRLTQEWARVRAENQAKGRNIEHADAWIAATARLHNCALVTNNARHFSGTAREIGDWSGAAFDPAFPLVLRLA